MTGVGQGGKDINDVQHVEEKLWEEEMGVNAKVKQDEWSIDYETITIQESRHCRQ